jgi:hypothetical protein
MSARIIRDRTRFNRGEFIEESKQCLQFYLLLYGREILRVTLAEEQRGSAGDGMLLRMFGPDRQEVLDVCRKLCN